MTPFIENTPAITDDDLQTLLTKARRLCRAGDARQKAAVAELLPALEDLLEARHALREDIAQARWAAERRMLH